MVELDGGEVTVTQTLYAEAEIEAMFADKWAYLAQQQTTRQPELPFL